LKDVAVNLNNIGNFLFQLLGFTGKGSELKQFQQRAIQPYRSAQ
jgi:hypothetical protein